MKYYYLCFFLFLISCNDARVFENQIDLGGYWTLSDSKTFEFDVKDSTKSYDITGSVRNQNKYIYYNLYIKYELYRGDSLLMTDLAEVILFEPKTGKPLGRGLGDTFNHEFEIMKDYVFAAPDTYQMKLSQFMRLDTLQYLDRIGLRVSQTTPDVIL